MRKNCIRTLIAALLIASTLSVTAFAETALVTGSEVNVRSGPDGDYAILGSYSRGDTVDVIDRGDGAWYAVNYDGTVGYMSADYLSLQADGSAIIVSATPDPAVSGQAVIVGNESPVSMQPNGQITGMYVRFRAGPSSSTAILGEYNQGKAVTVLGAEGDWTLCWIDGEYGYIFSEFVSSTAATVTVTPAADAAVTITPEAEATILITPAPSVSTPGIVIEQSDGAAVQTPVYGPGLVFDYSYAPPAAVTPDPALVFVTPTPVPEVGSAAVSGVPGTITGDYVRFRRGPGTDYSIIRSYDHGQAVTVIASEGEWTYCTIDGLNGYIFSQYVQTTPVSASSAAAVVGGAGQTAADPNPPVQPTAAPAPVPTSAVGSPGYIKGNNVRFRAGPDLSAEIIGELYYGNVVTITGSDGTWTSLICSGQAGYVFSQYVAPGTLQTASTGGSASGREIADYALQYVGAPYRWGGVDPSTGFDCSGFVYYVYKHFGYSLNRVASEQALNGKHVETADLQPGDLLCFYSGSSYIGHVGIYVGNNLFVHAATSSTGVITSELTGYYAQRGFEVRRLVG